MALEPITRQEQIIAGKDLKPITRMERFLKEYGDGSGGSGGGAGSVTVTFTYADEDWHDLIADKTLEELAELYRAGKKIDAVIHIDEGYGDNFEPHYLVYACFEDDIPSFKFSKAWAMDGGAIACSTIEYNTAYDTGEVQCFVTFGEVFPSESK